jgi:hypothetical protein
MKVKGFNKFKRTLTGRFFIILFVLSSLALLATLPVSGSPEFDVTNLNSLWLVDNGPTAQPVLRVNQRGPGMIAEFQDSGTRVWGITGGGKVIESGVNCFRANNTITDTASYTPTVTAISTPIWAECSLAAVTGDAAHCGAAFGATANVTITVKNTAATPAANAAGAVVYWEVCGTPQ